jgi:hypothetical protein
MSYLHRNLSRPDDEGYSDKYLVCIPHSCLTFLDENSVELCILKNFLESLFDRIN